MFETLKRLLRIRGKIPPKRKFDPGDRNSPFCISLTVQVVESGCKRLSVFSVFFIFIPKRDFFFFRDYQRISGIPFAWPGVSFSLKNPFQVGPHPLVLCVCPCVGRLPQVISASFACPFSVRFSLKTLSGMGVPLLTKYRCLLVFSSVITRKVDDYSWSCRAWPLRHPKFFACRRKLMLSVACSAPY